MDMMMIMISIKKNFYDIDKSYSDSELESTHGPLLRIKIITALLGSFSYADLPVGKQNLKYLVKCWDMIHNQQGKRLCLSKV